MEVRTNFGPANGNILVDSMLGSSYDTVKKVAQNIEVIKKFDNTVDVDFMRDNLSTLQNVSTNAADIRKVSVNMVDILAAPTEAKQYSDLSKNYATQAQGTINDAVEKGTAYVDEAKQVAVEIQNAAQELKTNVDIVNENQDAINIVADVADKVVTVGENIDDVTTVADYIDLTYAKPENVQDWGVIGTEEPSPDCGTSPLSIVAASAQHIKTVAENIDSILFIAKDGNAENLKNLAAHIKDYVEQVETYKIEISEYLKTFDEKKDDFEDYYVERRKIIDEVITNYAQVVASSEAKIAELIEAIKDVETNCKEAAEEANRFLIEIKDYYALTKEQIELAARRGLHDLRVLSDDLMLKLHRVFEDNIDRIEIAVQKQVDVALEKVDNHTDLLFHEFEHKVKHLVKFSEEKFQQAIDNTMRAYEQEFLAFVKQQQEELHSTANSSVAAIQQETVTSLAQIKEAENNALANMEVKTNEFLTMIEDGKLGLYRHKGDVPTVDDLPQDAKPGDVYNIIETGANYVWTGSRWDKFDPDRITDLGIIGS